MRTSDLDRIVGKNNVTDGVGVLEKYSRDQSFCEAGMPQWVVFPKKVEQIYEIVSLANKEGIPVTPFSSGLNFQGAAIPKKGGIVLDMHKMNKILEVHKKDRWVLIEPGVTYEQLQNCLLKHGCRFMLPFGVPPQRTVLSSQLERDPSLASCSFNYGNDQILALELILPTGEKQKTFGWIEGGRPQTTFNMQHRFWTGAQGTLGIATKGAIKIEHLPKMTKTFFFSMENLKEAVDIINILQRRGSIGWECFMLNDFNLAAILTKDWSLPNEFPCEKQASSQFEGIKGTLAAWVVIIRLTAPGDLLPEDKIAADEEVLREVCTDYGINPNLALAGLEKNIDDELLRPWSVLKKFNYKGSVQTLAFKSPPGRVEEFRSIIAGLAEKQRYPLTDMGGYVLPLERARAYHCEFDFFCDIRDEADRNRTHELWLEASGALVEAGAFFDRPYGPWAELVYSRAGMYATKLKELKKALDPNNIMNPGKLCF